MAELLVPDWPCSVILVTFLMSSLEEIRAAWISAICGRNLSNIVAVYFGLLMYATFYDCDPITTKVAKGRDQIVPLFVMKTLGQYPGLSGIFVAGVFSAALSTISSALNAMSAVVLEDFCKTLIKKPLTERQKIIIMKSVVIVFGVFGGSLAFFMDKLGTIVQLTFTIGTLTDGPSLGMFVMGLFMPWIKLQRRLLFVSTFLYVERSPVLCCNGSSWLGGHLLYRG
ncbi:putative sodium-dependent multivitamin transporter [Anabrus simplex]|uniref:putative sodium-dependent multivitamin transporter n=1 Tax=Anabrus simplex TaxID=316456 RepID=UPI0035A37808